MKTPAPPASRPALVVTAGLAAASSLAADEWHRRRPAILDRLGEAADEGEP